jgi:hypothetical protein
MADQITPRRNLEHKSARRFAIPRFYLYLRSPKRESPVAPPAEEGTKSRLLKRSAALVGIGCGFILGWPAIARGQYVESYLPRNIPGYNQEMGVTVLSRARPLYEEPGVRAGSFIIRPQLNEQFGYDSSPIGLSSSPGSWLLRTSPSIGVNSDWSRNSLGGQLSVDNYNYWNTPRQSYTDWTASIGGGYTIGRENLTLAYAHLSQHESPADVGAVPSDTPVHYQVDEVRTAYTFDLGRISLTPNLSLQSYYFDNTTILGVPVSQQYRDRVVLQGGVTLAYPLTDLRRLLFVLQGINSHFTRPQQGAPTNNSTSYLAMGGLDYPASGVWRYQLLAGIEVRDFQSPQFKTHTAPIAEANVIWSPTGLTTVTGVLARVIEDPSSEDASGYVYTTAHLIVDHEYLRNVLLQGRMGVQAAQYLQGSTQTSFTFGAGVNWLMNRKMRLSVDYDFVKQSGGSSATFSGEPNLTTLNTGGYTRSVFLIGMHFAL